MSKPKTICIHCEHCIPKEDAYEQWKEVYPLCKAYPRKLKMDWVNGRERPVVNQFLDNIVFSCHDTPFNECHSFNKRGKCKKYIARN